MQHLMSQQRLTTNGMAHQQTKPQIPIPRQARQQNSGNAPQIISCNGRNQMTRQVCGLKVSAGSSFFILSLSSRSSGLPKTGWPRESGCTAAFICHLWLIG